MKHLSTATNVILAIFFICSSFSLATAAADKATKEDCVALAKKAAQMIETDGVEATLEKINDRKGPFILKDTYVFCLTSDTLKVIGHPYASKRWRSLSQQDYMDPHGTLIFQEFVNALKDKDEAWVEYAQYRPQAEMPSMKTSYIMKIPDQNLIVGAGVYE